MRVWQTQVHEHSLRCYTSAGQLSDRFKEAVLDAVNLRMG
jgi:hypothetical protein